MEQLPAEIVLNIFALATADDIKTAFNLCLVSSATQRIVTALLYKHVVITGTDQVRRFNASFKLLPPRTLKLIRGMTLLDKKLAIVERDYREEKLDREAQCKGGWIKQWKDLIRYIGHLSRRYRLDTLVIHEEVEARFQYEDHQYKEPLAKQLSENNIRIQHLVLSHADLDFFLSKIHTEKLTWYGCDLQLARGSLDVVSSNTKVRCRQMKEISIYLGENYEYIRSNLGKEKAKDLESPWDTIFLRHLGEICKTQQGKPTVKVFLHRKTQGPLEDLKKMVSVLDFKVSVGLWGRTMDTCQREAELESIAAEGWMTRAPMRYLDEPAQKDSSSTFKGDSQPTNTGTWIMRRPPGKQWCGCFDLESALLRMATMEANQELDDSDDYGYDDYGYGSEAMWSDDSDNWDPMQRLAFLSGESHHYSQAYLDRWAL